MLKKFTLLASLIFSLFTANAQFKLGINAGVNAPIGGIHDKISYLHPGASFFIDPSYTLGHWVVLSKIGYQSFNVVRGFKDFVKDSEYTSARFSVKSNTPGFLNFALGLGYDLLRIKREDGEIPRPSVVLSTQFGVLKPSSETNLNIDVDEQAIYGLNQSKKTIPYINAGFQLVYPLSNRFTLTPGLFYLRSVSDMEFRFTHGNTSNLKTSYNDIQISLGIQYTFKKVKPSAKTAGSPIGGIVVKGGQNGLAKGENPLYEGQGGTTINPLSESAARATGSPIGGVVVKWGTTQYLLYNEDFEVKDETLLNYLGVKELIIQKGEYPFDYQKNKNGDVTIKLMKKIVHKDLAAKNMVFNGFDDIDVPVTYTIEPVSTSGTAKKIIVSYKGITEKGIK